MDKALDGRLVRGAQTQPLEYAVGKHWTTRFLTTFKDGRTGDTSFTFKVVARENITVPAGTFNAFRIEGGGTNTGPLPNGQIGQGELEYKYWVAPDKLRVSTVVLEETIRIRDRIVRAVRSTLVSYKET